MNAQRTQAYGRVMHTLDELGPSKLQNDEQERIRQDADTLIFSTELSADPEAQAALHDIFHLCRDLVASGRWEEETARRLATDLRDCGPEADGVSRQAA
ncbi:MAG TPA: hypothetical protein VF781_10970 [Solirubrobacteraceae bacterium]